MEAFLRLLGWATSLALLLLFGDGVLERLGVWWHPDWHVGAGIGLLLVVPLLYVLPYFQLVGVGAALRREPGIAELEARLDLLSRLKTGLFWPVLRTILLLVAGPILGFLGRGAIVPPWSHGAAMALLIVAHVDLWARSLRALRIARELLRA